MECKVTGFVGIAISRYEHMNGCIQYDVKPKVGKDNEDKKRIWIDEQQLTVVGKDILSEPKLKGGGFREHPV